LSPGGRTRTPTRAEAQSETRRHLLLAASRLFLRNGFVATSLANIADEAGVTKGAVYSNFASKEDLFLALLQEPIVDQEVYAPSKVDGLGAAGAAAGEAFGRYAAGVRPSRAHVALFLETNAAALRSDRVREYTGANTRRFAVELGHGLCEAFDAPDADPLAVGLLAQSLYAGLLMHGAFLDEIDADMFAVAYAALAAGVRHVTAERLTPGSGSKSKSGSKSGSGSGSPASRR
jgi:AcrR family transcriptional regulator